MTRAAIYRRVSTQGQAQDDKFSLDEQAEKTRAWCESKGYDIVADFGEVHSGSELVTRPKINTLLDMVQKQQIDVVVLTTLDRLSRDTTHQHVILYRIEEYNARIELTEETYEDSLQGKLMRTLSGAFAEMERQKIMERTVRGKRQRVREGLMIPSRVPLYGYSWADERKSRYIINLTTAPIAIRIWNEAAAGKPMRRIAADLTADGIDCPADAWRREKNDPHDLPRGGAWLRNTINRLLHHPAYWGEYSALRWDMTGRRKDIDPVSGQIKIVREARIREMGGIRIAMPKAAPALISPELARQVQERLTQNKLEASRRNKHPERSLLRGGYITCGVCHSNMTSSTNKDRTTYRCSRGRVAEISSRCENASPINAATLDAAVWGAVMTVLSEPEYFEQEMVQRINQDDKQDSIHALTRHVKDLESQEASISQAIRYMREENAIARLAADLEAITRERHKTKEELEQLRKDQLSQSAIREQLKAVKTMMYGITQAGLTFTYDEKRAFVYMLNIRVVVNPSGVDPRYTITAGKHAQVRLPLRDCDSMMLRTEHRQPPGKETAVSTYDSLDPSTWPKETPESATAGTPVHVLFVIDSSGSMEPKAADVRGGFNSYVSTLREDTQSAYRLTAVTFDTQVKTLFTDVPLAEVPPLDSSNYRPGGNTALYDALGVSLDELTSALRQEDHPYGTDRVLVIVMTDGQENSSRRFSKQQVSDGITGREAAGNWTFVYLGADQDAWASSEDLGFAQGNVAGYAGSSTPAMFRRLSRSTMRFSASSAPQMRNFGETLSEPDPADANPPPADADPKEKP
jgi:site-specific DNA recombinase